MTVENGENGGEKVGELKFYLRIIYSARPPEFAKSGG